MRTIYCMLMAGLLLAASVGYARGDSMDDAEAAKRGVPVQQVQLERAQVRISDLEKQLAKAKADNASLAGQLKTANDHAAAAESKLAALQSAITPDQKKLLSATDEIAASIKRREVMVGMSTDDVSKVCDDSPRLTAARDDVKTYTWNYYGSYINGNGKTVHDVTALITADVRNGKVISFTRDGVSH